MLRPISIPLLLWLPLSISGSFSVPREIVPSEEIVSVGKKDDSPRLNLHVQDYPQYVILSFKPHSGVTLDGIDFTGPQGSTRSMLFSMSSRSRRSTTFSLVSILRLSYG